MALTPNILMAVEALLANTALAEVPLETATYTGQDIVVSCQAAITRVDLEWNPGDDPYDAFTNYINATIPYIAGAVSHTDILTQHRVNLNAADNQEFVQYALIAMGAVDTANKYVNTAVNAASMSAQTFTSQEALMTGNIGAVTSNTQLWGQELINTGILLDFVKLDNLGTPQALVEALMRVNMLTSIGTELGEQGIDVFDLQKVIAEDSDYVLRPLTQKRCYDAFAQVTGDKLTEILTVMEVTTPNITALVDLLDLTKIFPSSVLTLTAPFNGTLRNIYTNSSTISSYTDALETNATAMMPDDIAKANYAFTISLGQIKGIYSSTPALLGQTALGMEGQDGLANTSALTQAVPTSTTNGIIAEMGGGTGPNTTYYLSDVIGAPAGIPYNDVISILNTNIAAIQAAGGYDSMIEVFDKMTDLLAGNFDSSFDFGGFGSPGIEDAIIISEPWLVFEQVPVTTTESGSKKYHIAYAGNTDFTAIGAPNNNVGTLFSATGPGTGSGRVTGENGASKLVSGAAWFAGYGRTRPMAALQSGLEYHVPVYTSTYSTEHAAMLAAFFRLGGVIAGIQLLWDANVRFETTLVDGYETGDPAQDGLNPQRSSTLAFAEGLPQSAQKTGDDDIVEILEAMVQNTQGGDAIIAAMREGRNSNKLDEAGVTGDNEISDQPPA